MRLNIDALQELYNTLTYGPVLSSPYAESPIDRAFKECDEKLSGSVAFAHIKNLENRCENLERSNKALRDDNDKLSDKAIELAKKKEQLEKDLDAKTKENSTLVSANADLSDRNAKLQRNFDRINHLWTSQIQENMELRSKIADLQEPKPKLVDYEALRNKIADLQQEKKNVEKLLNYYKHSYYDLGGKAHRAEDEVEDLKKELQDTKTNLDYYMDNYSQVQKDLTGTRKDLDFYFNKYQELKKDYETVMKERDDLTKKGEDLKKLINSVYGTTTRRLADALSKNGMYELWGKLQEVGDATRSERLGYFQDVCDIDDLVEWDLEDFLNEYNEWQKKKEKKERDCDRCEMKNPTFYFDNHPVMMGGTLEATAEVDKDLLNTVLGIKPKEEEEEHQLDYGDAVRVPWKSYDYMYIGPEGKHIRLFDPKTHTVVVVSVTDNLTYQGCKIILCDEDDIRKIWKDKK